MDLLWSACLIFAIFCTFLLSFQCLKFFRRRGRFSSAVSPTSIVNENIYYQITNLSNSSTDSDVYQYHTSPNLPEFNIPEGVTDGLSDFGYSIMVDQPLVLTHPKPFCKQSAVRKPHSSSSDLSSTITSGKKYKIVDERPRRHSEHCSKHNKEEDESPVTPKPISGRKRSKAVPIKRNK